MLSYKGGSFSPDTVPHQLHLRTISTNDPHPVAASPIIDLKVSQASRYQLRYQDDLVQIHGRMIGVRFGGYRNPTLKPLIMVWNWVTGIEVVHLELRPRGQYSMTFLSEKYILVPELAAPIAGTTWSYNQLGRLDIYQVPLDKRTESLDYPIANFILPEPAEQQNSVHLRVSTSPAPAPESAQLQPKIYEMPLENRYIHIYISTSIDNDRNDPSWRASSRPGLHGLLYVSTGTLLDFLNQICHSVGLSVPVSIPWSEWGCQASWVSWPSAQYMNGFSWGQRHAFRYNVKAETHQTRYMTSHRFCILDHNQSRAKIASYGSCGLVEVKQSEGQMNSAVTQDVGSAPLSREAAEKITFREALSSGMRYTEVPVRMEAVNELLSSNSIIFEANNLAPLIDMERLSGGFESIVIDDEHLVVLVPKGPSTLTLAGLLVYDM
ncbi:unnamed protein product [Rhizoctonia solani]|uniref:Uncharacterized protein n=1 Tax=Rhizoctonia solani TaxID=456999 RepID=A0A8H3CVX4_9AGAM|nr:unnamed protein product [Rhizoctonia solani]